MDNFRNMDVRILVLASFFLMICLMALQIVVHESYDNQAQIEMAELIEKQAEIQLKIKDVHVRFNQQAATLENIFSRRKGASIRQSELNKYYEQESATQEYLNDITLALEDKQFLSLIQEIRGIQRVLGERFREAVRVFNTRSDTKKSYIIIDEVLGNSISDFSGLIASLNDLVTTVKGDRIEQLHKTRENRHFYNWLFVAILSVPFVAFLYILLDRKVKALWESEANFAALTANMQDGALVNYAGKNVFANRSLAKMLGYNNEKEIVGTTVGDIVHPSELERVLHFHQLRKQGKDVPDLYETQFITSKGKPLPVEVCASLTTWKGKAAGLVTVRDNTERQQAERTLQESQSRYQRAEKGTSDGLWEWNIITSENYFSPRWLEMLGYEPGELPYHVDAFFNLIHPDDKTAVQKAVEEHLHINTPYDVDMRLRKKNGDYLWVNARGQAERDDQGKPTLMTGVISDISRRRQAEEELQKSELWMTNIFNTLEEAVLVVTPDRELLNVNDAAIRMFGYSQEEIAKESTSLFHVDEQHYLEFGKRISKAFSEGEVAHFEFEAKRKNGEIFPTEHSVSLLKSPDGTTLGIVSVVIDITERKKTEVELDKYRHQLEALVENRTRELRDAQDELVRKERLATLGQLTATVSHELRNPLGAMRPSLYFINKKINREDENLQQAIEILDRNIQRCDRIIDELLDFTRITEIELHSTSIDDWLDSVINEQQFPAGIELDKHYSLGDLDVAIDSDRLRRAVINVLENACHAMMDENRKVINQKNARLTVETGINAMRDNRIEITITDNGCGIPPDIQEKIFEPLFSTKTFGVGLGMSTVRQIMLQHHGGIDIDSKQGEGTSVVLWISNAHRHEAVI